MPYPFVQHCGQFMSCGTVLSQHKCDVYATSCQPTGATIMQITLSACIKTVYSCQGINMSVDSLQCLRLIDLESVSVLLHVLSQVNQAVI